MTRHREDQTRHDTTSTTAGDRRLTATARVEAAMVRLDRASIEVGPVPTTNTGWVSYCTALAWISARRAGWWRVLLVADRRTRQLPPVAERAAGIAYHRARDDARFWRDTAAEYRARAEGRPTSDAAGALSNWHELRVTA
jgi:hypothetical protein